MKIFCPLLFHLAAVTTGLFLSFGTECAGQEASPNKLVSLQEAVEQAFHQSLEAKRAVLSLEQARLNVESVETEDDVLLILNGAWGTRWQEKSANSAAKISEHSRIHSYTAQVRYTLFDFGRQNAKESAAESAKKIQELTRDETDEKIFFTVVRAYQDVAASERLVTIVREQLTISQSRLAQQMRNYKQGLRSESDVVTAEVDVGRAQIALQTNLNQVLLAKRSLLRILRPESLVDTDFSVEAGTVAKSGPKQWEELIRDIEKLAVAQTTTQKLLIQSRENLFAEEQSLEALVRPVIGTVISGDYSGDSGNWSPMRPAASGQLQISWDVPWNGRNRLAKTALTLKKQDLALRESSLNLILAQNILNAKTQVDRTKSLFESMQVQLKLVGKQRTLVNDRYQSGQASALDLSSAEAALVNMRLELAKLSNTVASAIIMLAETRGVRSTELLKKL